MQLCVGFHRATADAKEAELNQVAAESDRQCYSVCWKDYVLIAVISKKSIDLRCMLQLIVVPLHAEFPRLDVLLHLSGLCNSTRALIPAISVHNVSIKPLDLLRKVVYQIVFKAVKQDNELSTEPLPNVGKLKVVIGSRLHQCLKTCDFLGEKLARTVGKSACSLQHCLNSLSLYESQLDSLQELCINSADPLNKKSRSKNGYNFQRNGSDDVVKVGRRLHSMPSAGPTLRIQPLLSRGFHRATTYPACLNYSSGTALSAPSEYYSIPYTSLKCDFKSNLVTCQVNNFRSTYEVAYGGSQIYKETSNELSFDNNLHRQVALKSCSALFTIADGTEKFDAIDYRFGELLAKHMVQTQEREMLMEFDVKNLFRRHSVSSLADKSYLIDKRIKYDESASVPETNGDFSQLRMHYWPIHREQIVNMTLTSSTGQGPSKDSHVRRNNKGNGSSTSSPVQPLAKQEVGNNNSDKTFSYTENNTDVKNTESNVIYCSESLEGDTGSRKDLYDGGKGKHDHKISSSSREAPSDSQRGRSKKTNERTSARGKKVSGSGSTSETSSNGGSQSSTSPVEAFVSSAKGSGTCVWKKIERPTGYDNVDGHQTESFVHLNLSEKSAKQPGVPDTHKAVEEGNKNLQDDVSEDISKSQGQKGHTDMVADGSCIRFHCQVESSPKKVQSDDYFPLKMPPNAKEKQISLKSTSKVTKAGKGIWTRKSGSSSNDKSLLRLEKHQEESLRKEVPKLPDSKRNTHIQNTEARSSIQCSSYEFGHSVLCSGDILATSKSLETNTAAIDKIYAVSGTTKGSGEHIFCSNLENHMETSGTMELKHIPEEKFLHPSTWKGRSAGFLERGLSREKQNERYRQQVFQKWVPVESNKERAFEGGKLDTEMSRSIELHKLGPSFSLAAENATSSNQMNAQELESSDLWGQTEASVLAQDKLISTGSNFNTDWCCSAAMNKNDVNHELMENISRALSSIRSSYKTQMRTIAYTEVTGRPIAEFEKIFGAAAPVIMSLNYDKNIVSKWHPIDKTLICCCRIPNVSLQNVWQWYEEHGNYGLEVRAHDPKHSSGLGDGGKFRAYFVPYLSGIQLFGYSSDQNDPCYSEGQRQDNPNENIVEDDNCSCNCRSRTAQLLFEYFESEQPHQRQPMFDKIRQLTADYISQKDCNSDILKSAYICNLHPASWFAVAWYPIYRVPEGQLRTAFLTYHSLGHLLHKSALGNLAGIKESSIIAPVFGMRSYSNQAECWFYPSRGGNHHNDPCNLYGERIKVLEGTADLISRGIAKARSTSERSKHSDYEFFLGRQRSMYCS